MTFSLSLVLTITLLLLSHPISIPQNHNLLPSFFLVFFLFFLLIVASSSPKVRTNYPLKTSQLKGTLFSKTLRPANQGECECVCEVEIVQGSGKEDRNG